MNRSAALVQVLGPSNYPTGIRLYWTGQGSNDPPSGYLPEDFCSPLRSRSLDDIFGLRFDDCILATARFAVAQRRAFAGS